MVAKKLVVVALLEVELRAVKFCKVEEPLERKVEKVPKPVEVTLPPLKAVAKRFVDEAVVEKKFVEVALVVVLLVVIVSVRPLRIAKLLSVVVAAKLVSKRPPKVVVYTPLVTVPALPETEPVMI